jgi:hypothetical protein
MNNGNVCPIIKQFNDKIYMNNMSLKARYNLARVQDKLKNRTNMFERMKAISLDKDIYSHHRSVSKQDIGYLTMSNMESVKYINKINDKINDKFNSTYGSYKSVTPHKMKFKSKLPDFKIKPEMLSSTTSSLFKFSRKRIGMSSTDLPSVNFKSSYKAREQVMMNNLNRQRKINEHVYDCFNDLTTSRAMIDKKIEERISQLEKMKFE